MKPNTAIPILFIILIASFIGFDGLFIYIAEKTYSGSVTENAYQKGIDFLKEQDITELGFKIDISYSNHALNTSINCIANTCGKIEKIEAKLIRPATHKYDKIYQLKSITPKLYTVSIGILENGQWEVRLKIHTTQGMKYFSKRIFVNNT